MRDGGACLPGRDLRQPTHQWRPRQRYRDIARLPSAPASARLSARRTEVVITPPPCGSASGSFFDVLSNRLHGFGHHVNSLLYMLFNCIIASFDSDIQTRQVIDFSWYQLIRWKRSN